MLRIRMPQYAPPGGRWFYTEPQSGRSLESLHSMADLELKVVDAIQASGFSVPLDLRARIEHFMCERLPDGYCAGEGARLPGVFSISYFEILKNLEHLRAAAAELVDPKTAETRAAVCRACHENDIAMCTSCNDLQGQTLRTVRGRRVLNLPYLGVCRRFGVPTYGLVWAAGTWKVDLPDNCWAKPAEPKGE